MHDQADINKMNISKLYQKMHETLTEREQSVKKTI